MDGESANFPPQWDIEESSDPLVNLYGDEQDIIAWVPVGEGEVEDTDGWVDITVKYRVVGGEMQILIRYHRWKRRS